MQCSHRTSSNDSYGPCFLVRDLLRRIVPKAWRERASEPFAGYLYGTRSYAQEGEDLLLLRLLHGQRTGFYVDVGAHHPFRFSNTYLFYRMGWQGIVIDAIPGTEAKFRRCRPRDIAIETGVARQPGMRSFYQFDDPALNTFDPSLAEQRQQHGRWRLLRTTPIPCRPLSAILDEHLPSPTSTIDFLSVDVEGEDLAVLQSNDWQRFRPTIVVVESLVDSTGAPGTTPVVEYLQSLDYAPVSTLFNSMLFRARR